MKWLVAGLLASFAIVATAVLTATTKQNESQATEPARDAEPPSQQSPVGTRLTGITQRRGSDSLEDPQAVPPERSSTRPADPSGLSRLHARLGEVLRSSNLESLDRETVVELGQLLQSAGVDPDDPRPPFADDLRDLLRVFHRTSKSVPSEAPISDLGGDIDLLLRRLISTTPADQRRARLLDPDITVPETTALLGLTSPADVIGIDTTDALLEMITLRRWTDWTHVLPKIDAHSLRLNELDASLVRLAGSGRRLNPSNAHFILSPYLRVTERARWTQAQPFIEDGLKVAPDAFFPILHHLEEPPSKEDVMWLLQRYRPSDVVADQVRTAFGIS